MSASEDMAATPLPARSAPRPRMAGWQRALLVAGRACRRRRADVRAGKLPPVPAHHGGDHGAGGARAEHRHRLQRPDLARARRLLRGRRLCHGDPDVARRLVVLGDAARLRRGLRRRRLRRRLPGAAAGRALPGADHLLARRRRAAAAEAPLDRGLDRRRAGPVPGRSRTRPPGCRSTPTSGCTWSRVLRRRRAASCWPGTSSAAASAGR